MSGEVVAKTTQNPRSCHTLKSAIRFNWKCNYFNIALVQLRRAGCTNNVIQILANIPSYPGLLEIWTLKWSARHQQGSSAWQMDDLLEMLPFFLVCVLPFCHFYIAYYSTGFKIRITIASSVTVFFFPFDFKKLK